MTVINHETFITVEMIENSHHVMSDNLTQIIEIIMNYHSKNTEIKNVTKVEIVSVTD